MKCRQRPRGSHCRHDQPTEGEHRNRGRRLRSWQPLNPGQQLTLESQNPVARAVLRTWQGQTGRQHTPRIEHGTHGLNVCKAPAEEPTTTSSTRARATSPVTSRSRASLRGTSSTIFQFLVGLVRDTDSVDWHKLCACRRYAGRSGGCRGYSQRQNRPFPCSGEFIAADSRRSAHAAMVIR